MDKRLSSFAMAALVIAAAATFFMPSWGASFAQNTAYEVRPRGGLDITTVVNPPLCPIAVGQDYWVAALVVDNEHPMPIPDVLFVTQDIDSNGMVESIELVANVTLPAAESIRIGNRWEPLSSGNHTIEAFLWQMDSTSGSPSAALIEKQSMAIEVAEKC